jgi:hypothetical protein
MGGKPLIFMGIRQRFLCRIKTSDVIPPATGNILQRLSWWKALRQERLGVVHGSKRWLSFLAEN